MCLRSKQCSSLDHESLLSWLENHVEHGIHWKQQNWFLLLAGKGWNCQPSQTHTSMTRQLDWALAQNGSIAIRSHRTNLNFENWVFGIVYIYIIPPGLQLETKVLTHPCWLLELNILKPICSGSFSTLVGQSSGGFWTTSGLPKGYTSQMIKTKPRPSIQVSIRRT